jgi:hypothetical protein
MAVVPLMLFLARRDGTHGNTASGGPEIPDIRAASEAWYQKGIAEGMEKAREVSEAAIAQKEEECKSRLIQARRSWSQTQAALLAQLTTASIAGLKSEIEETVARILRPLVEKALVEDALSKFGIEIGKLLSDDDAIRLRISGPSDLVSQLGSLIPQNVPVTIIEGDTPEVTVFANKTVIETRLHEWLECTGVDSHAAQEEG